MTPKENITPPIESKPKFDRAFRAAEIDAIALKWKDQLNIRTLSEESRRLRIPSDKIVNPNLDETPLHGRDFLG